MPEKELQTTNLSTEIQELLSKMRASGELDQYLPQAQEPILCELLVRDYKGNIKQSNENCQLVLQRDETLKDAIRFNEFTGQIDVVKQMPWKRLGNAFSDNDLDNIITYMEINYGLHVDKQIERAVRVVAKQNSYHPIRDKLNALVWDGEERLQNVLTKYLGVPKSPLVIESLKVFMLGAIETGVRVGELCSLKWEDIRESSIHIHSQQLNKSVEGGKEYYLVPYTKNEKGESEDGRDFPLTQKIKELLLELKCKQEALGIRSEFIFCHEDGEWIKTDAYITFLRRLCQSKNFNVTNNHALRMSLNSNVLLPLGISAADRAAMLGHSIETNLKYYSFAQKDYLDNVRALLDSVTGDGPAPTEPEQGTPGNPSNVINFPKKKAQNA